MYSTSSAFRAVGRKLQAKSRQAASATAVTATVNCLRERFGPLRLPRPAGQESLQRSELSLDF